jgi:hypothetical protein
MASAAPAPESSPASATPPVAAATQPEWPQGAPTAAAVLVHRGSRCRLALADLVHGTYEDLGPADDNVNPVWSPDGTQLAYIDGSTLTLLRPGKGAAVRVRGGLPVGKRPERGYAFSPDGQRLAVATMRGIEIYGLGETVTRLAAAPSKLVPSTLSWAQDGQRLVACLWNGDTGPGTRQSLSLYSLDGSRLSSRVLQAKFPGCAILGLRHDRWVSNHNDRDSIAEEVVAVSADGKSSRLLALPSDYTASAYLPARDAIAAAEGTEDDAGPTPWALFSLSDRSQRPFLRKYRIINDIRASEDGNYALVTVPFPTGALDEPGGRVFLHATEGTFARQVLPAPGSKSKNPSFSHPVPRPLPRTSP